MESMLNDFLNINHNVKYYDIEKYMKKLGFNVIKTVKYNKYNHDDTEYAKYLVIYIENNKKILGFFHDISCFDEQEQPYAKFQLLITIGIKNCYCCRDDYYNIYEINKNAINDDILEILEKYNNSNEDISNILCESTKFSSFWNDILIKNEIHEHDHDLNFYNSCDYCLCLEFC